MKENSISLGINFKLLTMDVKTRWNSSLKMLTVFNDMMPAVKKTIQDYGHLWHTYLEISVPELISTLQPCKMAMDAISGDDSDLNMAEGALEFLLKEIKLQQQSFLRDRLLEELLKEIEKRRPKLTVSLLKFLNNPGVLDEKQVYPFLLSKKEEIIKEGIRIWRKHFSLIHNDDDDDDIDNFLTDVTNVEPPNTSDNARSRLVASMKRRTTSNFVPKPPKKKRSVKINPNELSIEDFNIYISSGVKSEKLTKLEVALKLIKATSIRSEQNFSIASSFRSKKREKMKCSTMSDLSVLKSYFNKKKNI